MNIKSIKLTLSDFRLLNTESVETEQQVVVNQKVLLKTNFGTDSDSNLNGVVALGVLIEQKDIPFRLEVQYVAEFCLIEENEKKCAERLARMNVAAMIFPYIRQEVSERTMKACFSPLILPPLNFVAMYQEYEQKQKEKVLQKMNKQNQEDSVTKSAKSSLSHDSAVNTKGQKEKN